jgi:hypothetical protein
MEDEFILVLPHSHTLLTLEMDEVWRFISQKKKQSWLWVALDRATRRVVAWVCGDRREQPLGDYGKRCQRSTGFTVIASPIFGQPITPLYQKSATVLVGKTAGKPATLSDGTIRYDNV